jgi:hypothetical protein
VYPYGVVVEPIIGKIIDVHNKWEMLGMKKFLISLVVVLAAVVGGSAVTPGTTAQAAGSKFGYVKNTPKKMRGTWYYKRSKREGGMYRIVIKKHKVTMGSMTFKNLTIAKTSQKGRISDYSFNSKTSPVSTSGFFSYTKKINGKKRNVMVEIPQGTGMRPAVYTHFKPKQAYSVSASVLKRLSDPITQ